MVLRYQCFKYKHQIHVYRGTMLCLKCFFVLQSTQKCICDYALCSLWTIEFHFLPLHFRNTSVSSNESLMRARWGRMIQPFCEKIFTIGAEWPACRTLLRTVAGGEGTATMLSPEAGLLGWSPVRLRAEGNLPAACLPWQQALLLRTSQ